jgi:hypothetical protein
MKVKQSYNLNPIYSDAFADWVKDRAPSFRPQTYPTEVPYEWTSANQDLATKWDAGPGKPECVTCREARVLPLVQQLRVLSAELESTARDEATARETRRQEFVAAIRDFLLYQKERGDRISAQKRS